MKYQKEGNVLIFDLKPGEKVNLKLKN